ncbi:MAG: hypothetical protein GWP05_06175 [Anaerolineaceae bacterium]|nr:hypothetical protein [Anaerolineaceae bacterium]
MKSQRTAAGPTGVLSRRSRAAGFTMIEMVMVIGIILFLLAVLIVVVGNVQATAQKKETNLLIDAIESALTEYYIINGEYPDLTAWSGNFGPAQRLYWELTSAEKGACMKDIPPGMTRTPVSGGKKDKKYFVDAWQNPIQVVVFADGSRQALQNGGMPFVWSWGPDGRGWKAREVAGTSDLAVLVGGLDEKNQDNMTNFRDIPVN